MTCAFMHLDPCDLHPIRQARLSKGYSLRQLGALACVEFSKISRAEHGLELKPAELLRLAGVLGTSPEALRQHRVEGAARG
jgi:transcriptional regulator with XRE-family HTH domain